MRRLAVAISLAIAAAAGCQLISGVGDLEIVPATAQSSSATGSGGASSSSSAATGGAGGGGGACDGGPPIDCYHGLKGTLGVGECKAGKAACQPNLRRGPCVGEVDPRPENCTTPIDENCDAQTPSCTGDVLAASITPQGNSEIRAVAIDKKTKDIVVVGSTLGWAVVDGKQLPSAGDWDAFVVRLAADQSHAIWSTVIGGSGEDRGTSVSVDVDGRIVVGGYFKSQKLVVGGSTLNNAGGADAFLVRLDAQGSPIWAQARGSAGDDATVGVTADDDGNLVDVGNESGNVFIELRDPQDGHLVRGDQPWTGAGTHKVTALSRIDGARRVFAVGGDLSGTLTIGQTTMTSTGPAAWVSVIDLLGGAPNWGKVFQAQTLSNVRGVGMDSAGQPTIGGSFQGPLTLGKDTLQGEGLYVAGLDVNGAPRWSAALAVNAAPIGLGDVIADGAGNVVLVGGYAVPFQLGAKMVPAPPGPASPFAIKLNGLDGSLLWTQLFVDKSGKRPFNAGANAVAVDLSLAPVVVGATFDQMLSLPENGPESGFVVRVAQ